MSAHRIALVTGIGPQRVGWYVAEALGERGYAVAVQYRRSDQAAAEFVRHFENQHREAAAFQAELSDEAAVKGLVASVVRQFGRLDVVVHCAAAWWPKPLEETTAADVRFFFDSNTLSTFLLCQHAGLVMVDQPDGGCIVTIGDWAVERPYANYSSYFPSKGAIPTLTRTMAVELGERNTRVRVNCILPGPVLLPEGMTPEERQGVIQSTLLKREGRPENVAQAVLALVENDYVTGVCLPVDGGRSIYAPDGQ